MIKKYLFFLFLLSGFNMCLAQDRFRVFEIYAGLGTLPQYKPYLPDVVDNWQSLTSSSSSPHYYERNNEKNSQTAFHVGFLFHPSRNFGVGLSLSQAQSSYDAVGMVYRVGHIQPTKEYVGTVQAKASILMFNAEYSWWNRGAFTLYSKAGFGTANAKICGQDGVYPAITEQDESKREIVWSLMPLCADWHFTKNLALYLEGGYSGIGCVEGGLKATF